MYEDQNANILYDPNTIGLSSDCTLASNVEEDRSNVNDETNREAGITNQGDPRLEPCFLGPVDNQDKNSLNPVNPLASSDSDILTLTGIPCRKSCLAFGSKSD